MELDELTMKNMEKLECPKTEPWFDQNLRMKYTEEFDIDQKKKWKLALNHETNVFSLGSMILGLGGSCFSETTSL